MLWTFPLKSKVALLVHEKYLHIYKCLVAFKIQSTKDIEDLIVKKLKSRSRFNNPKNTDVMTQIKELGQWEKMKWGVGK